MKLLQRSVCFLLGGVEVQVQVLQLVSIDTTRNDVQGALFFIGW
jgi:hypothetical protein